MRKELRVMKFGGTSLGDASCIRKAVKIVCASCGSGDLVVVVSAMSGVTNSLIHAAKLSAVGERQQVSAILRMLRTQHETAASELLSSPAERNRLNSRIRVLLEQAAHECQEIMGLGELSPRSLDFISGLGERLSAPLVAAVLAEFGVRSEAIESTEVVVTTSDHGMAEPYMNLTRERCEARLFPLLAEGVVPVVTGFIGATPIGVPTTLGRNSSDYSATILGAAVNADSVTIWTDVDGVLTADPHLVRDARPIPEISYHEATQLACLGAKVLHPKTFSEVMQQEIPVWIRNTFAPDRAGTRISSLATPVAEGVKAVAAKCDTALISIEGPGAFSVPAFFERVSRATSPVQADFLLISHSQMRGNFCLVTGAASSGPIVEALKREFSAELERREFMGILADPTVAIITLVGQGICSTNEIIERASSTLRRENVHLIATSESPSDCTIPLIVLKKDMERALLAVHREFVLSGIDLEEISEECA